HTSSDLDLVQTCALPIWMVAFTYRSDAIAAREVEGSSGGQARAFVLDLLDREGPSRLMTDIEESIGPIDGLVNNGGIRRASLLEIGRASCREGEQDGCVE